MNCSFSSPYAPSCPLWRQTPNWTGVLRPSYPVHPLCTPLSCVWEEGVSCPSVIHGSLTSGCNKSMWESTAFTDKINHPSISISLSQTCYVTLGKWPNSIQIQLTHLTNGENNGESLTVVERWSIMCSKSQSQNSGSNLSNDNDSILSTMAHCYPMRQHQVLYSWKTAINGQN